MAVVKYSEAEVKLLARLMRAEAEGDGTQGMLLVGNVGINRVRANCLDFKDIRSIEQMVFQSPGGFEATQKGYFYQAAREIDIKLARRVINGERFTPGTKSLWFYNPFGADCRAQWWGQWNTGKYKSHCFYSPLDSEKCY
ncbi:MAG: cell wall hydrolase [bacterium]